MNPLGMIALCAGGLIAFQASLNARLGVLLGNPVHGTIVAFTCSCLVTLLFTFALARPLPSLEQIEAVPVYLWFSGGVLAALGVGLFYFLIPKMGMGPMMSYALTGQLIVSIIASHFGWFDLPSKSFNIERFFGILALIAGILLINRN